MKFSSFKVECEQALHCLSAEFVPSRATKEGGTIWFKIPSDLSAPLPRPEPFITAFYPVCMLNGEDIELDVPLPVRFVRRLERAGAILKAWHPHLQRIAIKCPVAAEEPAKTDDQRGVGCFFSGGVDSGYSILQNLERITHLVTVRGFDIGLNDEPLWLKTEQRLRALASSLNRKFVPIATNVREVADAAFATWSTRWKGDFWGAIMHGSSLASVAGALSAGLKEMIIPASCEYTFLEPWGSHPLIDPLWAIDGQDLDHHGCERSRMEKVFRIAESPTLVSNLRVCYKNFDNTYNCGRCEKCLRTMLALELTGNLDLWPGPQQLSSLHDFTWLELTRRSKRYYRELYEEAKRRGHPAVTHECEVLLGLRFDFRFFLHRLYRKAIPRSMRRFTRRIRSKEGRIGKS
jgi:hypothetical protein